VSKQRDRSKQSGAPRIERRWVQSSAPAADTDARIAMLLADVPPPPPLSPARLAAVAARLPGRPLPTRLPARLGIRWAIVLSFLLGSASAVFARKQIARLWDQVTTARPIFGPIAAPRRPPRRQPLGVSAETPSIAQPSIAEPESLDVPSETPLPMPDPASDDVSAETPPADQPRKLIAKPETLPVRPRPPQAGEGRGEGRASPPLSPAGIPRHLRASSAPPPAPHLTSADDPLATLTPPPQPPLPLPNPNLPAETADVLMPLPARPPATAPPNSVLHEEAALLRSAIESLRVQRRPSDALSAVTEHRRRFPSGALATDAQMLRVEALIALGRRQEALVALDDQRLAGEGPGGTLQVTRAELLADRNCSQAIAAFDDLLASATSSPSTIERALRGRAICHARLGDREAAQADWRAYLRRFPDGRFKEEAGRNLIRQ
jgi:hypothetical protein